MHAKKSALTLSLLIIIVAVTLLTLAGNALLGDMISNIYLRWALLLIVAAGIYLFLAPAIITPFLQTDAKLKEMLDHTLHELNTPIATIEANTTMLKRTCSDPKARKRLQRIQEAAQNLTRLYESIEYDIKEEIEHIEKSTFDLHPLIDESIQKFDDIRGDITLTNDTDHLMLHSDQNGFVRMVDNLLSNAIKYNKPDGWVKIYTKDHKLYIADSGIGIDPKNLFIVYEKSFQENPTTQGFGLGLSIVKNFCDREKITIKIDTQKHVGTTISLDLSNLLLHT